MFHEKEMMHSVESEPKSKTRCVQTIFFFTIALIMCLIKNTHTHKIDLVFLSLKSKHSDHVYLYESVFESSLHSYMIKKPRISQI